MTDFYIQKPGDLSDYACDQTVITKKKYLKHLSRVKYKEDVPSAYPKTVEWYPFTNSYYPYTEDVDAFARVSHVLGSKAFESLTSIPDCESLYEQDAYSEKLAQLQYLSSNPVSFLIIGKPGIGEQELGRLLADHWQCMYIEPETLIIEEINSGTRAGQCIEFNLRSGRAIGVDIILRLVEKRVKSKSAQHRGFVICGFPLIPNNLYEEEPLSSESAVFNVHEIFEEIFETTIDIGVPPEMPVSRVSNLGEEAPGEGGEEEEGPSQAPPPSEKTMTQPDVPLDIGSATSTICTAGDMETNFEEQINFIFSQFQKPCVIIYMVCGNSDVISKHNDCRFDFFTREIVDLQREHNDKIIYTFFSRVPGAVTDEIPDDFIDVVKLNRTSLTSVRSRQLVRLPRDFSCNMVALLDRYRYSALPVIERHILTHDVQYFMKVDGRISPIRMFNAVKTRLRVLPLQKVVLPQKLLVPVESEGEGPAEDIDVDELSFEECFEILRKRQIASPMFKWNLSEWGVKCPVSMKEGGYKDGDPKYAVQFMNKIFFLADEDAYLKFYRNPRPYLLPPYPKPSCKMFVMGPRCSGKTAVSRCLGYFLSGEVLDFDKLIKNALKVKQTEHEDLIRSAALKNGVAILNENRRLEWEKQQEKRVEKVEEWVQLQQNLLRETITLKEEHPREDETVSVVLEMSSFPANITYNRITSTVVLHDDAKASDSEHRKVRRTVEELQQLIQENGLPLDNIPVCQELLSDRDKLLDYLPPSLLPPETYAVEPATVFDDFVKEYAENAANTASYDDIELTSEYISEQLIEIIKDVEERSLEQGNNRGGWIVDGITANEELFNLLTSQCLPDDIFVLKDTDDHEFLLERFKTKGQNVFRDFRKLFMELEKLDAAWRSPSLLSTGSYKDRIAKDLLSDITDEAYFTSENKEPKEEEPSFTKHPRRIALEVYTNDLNKFDDNWDNLLNSISKFKITVTELQVTNKPLEVLLKEAIKNVEDRYRQLASEFTSEDRAQEIEDFGEPEMQGEELGEGEEKPETEDLFFQNRRFGDTFNYCPVTFHDRWVLWRGKEDHTAKFENKVYLMCDENARNAFIDNPRRYLLGNKPPENFPPPRICVVGPNGSGKTTVAKTLCRNLGLYNANYTDMLKSSIAPNSKFKLYEILKMGIAGALGFAVQNYFIADEPLPDALLKAMISPYWFENPAKLFGFVMDGFPKRPSDILYMAEIAAIPDIVVELSISQGEIHSRLIPEFIENWHKAFNVKQELLNRKHSEILHAWEERKYVRFRELMELKKEERYAAKLKEKEEGADDAAVKQSRPYLDDLTEVEEDDHSGLQAKSQVSYDSVAEEADIEEVNKIIAEEIPEPIFEEDTDETLEEAIERFAGEIDDSYSTELIFLRGMREQCEVELIPWVTVDAGMAEDKVFAQIMGMVDKYKFRNDSLFERVYTISVELADRLLASGYYFLSKFGKTCPVQVYDNINPVQMFLPLEQKFLLYPVIHRQYIYFLAQKENLDKFKENPLKYLSKRNVEFPLIPLKLAITGPPACGKTTLAERFKRDLGLKIISRGQAGRYVLRYLEFSELARNMESVLRRGWELTNEMMIKCAEAMSYDGKSITQGFVLDGFPSNIEEARHLAEVGLVPILVIDLQAESADIYEFLAHSKGKRNLPVFSSKFIEHRCEEWSKRAEVFRDWLEREYQIMAKVRVKPSKWGVWNPSYELATAVFSETKHYFKYAPCDMALRLATMQITPLEFIERQGAYKTYCPCCLHYSNALISGGDPPDRTGVLQFRNFYYYLCPGHIDEFIDDPERFLSPYNNHPLPPDLPVQVYLSEKPDQCHENGMCIICFWENRPRRVVNPGKLKFAVMYREMVYLFDDEKCMEKFMRKPHDFYAKVSNFKGTEYPLLNYNELPTLGLLQQYDVKQLIRAIDNTEVLRPVIPGLSISCSASLNIGLLLKLNNPRTPERFLQLYKAAGGKYNERRTNLTKYLAEMKKMINPYLYYDEVLPKFVDPLRHALASKERLLEEATVEPEQRSCEISSVNLAVAEESETTYSHYSDVLEYIRKIDAGDLIEARRVPVPDDRFEYLCNYFKPASKVPAFLNIVDIAGLVKGASEGQGLGNAFLSHISACDAIFHLCRAFEDTDVTHVEGEVDPVRDLEIIGEELRLKDEEQLEKHLEKLERTVVRGGDKKAKPEYETLVKIKSVLVDQKQHIRFSDWATNDIEVLNKYLFLTSKPAIYLINLAEKDYIKKKNKWLVKIKEWVDKNDPGATIIPFSGMFEQNVSEIEDPILRQKFLEDNHANSALDKIILQGYKALQLEYFFTAGTDEVKAWTIQKGTKAPQAAGKIHTDFEKGFIMAEVMKYADFKEEGSESGVKAAGKYRQQGRNYVVEDGDIIFFKFNAGAGLKDPKKK